MVTSCTAGVVAVRTTPMTLRLLSELLNAFSLFFPNPTLCLTTVERICWTTASSSFRRMHQITDTCVGGDYGAGSGRHRNETTTRPENAANQAMGTEAAESMLLRWMIVRRGSVIAAVRCLSMLAFLFCH